MEKPGNYSITLFTCFCMLQTFFSLIHLSKVTLKTILIKGICPTFWNSQFFWVFDRVTKLKSSTFFDRSFTSNPPHIGWKRSPQKNYMHIKNAHCWNCSPFNSNTNIDIDSYIESLIPCFQIAFFQKFYFELTFLNRNFIITIWKLFTHLKILQVNSSLDSSKKKKGKKNSSSWILRAIAFKSNYTSDQ